jgi:malonyl CoA-acyl carrier protein transacylase
MELLDPTAETATAQRQRAQRPVSLTGLTVGLLDIAKVRGDVFLNRVAELLSAKGLAVQRFRKPTYTKPATPDLRHEIQTRCHALIEGLAD